MTIASDVQSGFRMAASVKYFVAGLIVTLIVLWYLNSTLPGARQLRAFVGAPQVSSSG